MRDLVARIAIMAAGLLVALVGVAGAAIFVCVALYAFLLTMLPAYLAALATAGVLLLLSLIVLAIGAKAAKTRRRSKRTGARPGLSAGILGAELGKMLGEDAQAFVAKKPLVTLLLAVAGGFIVGVSPRLRALLLNILKG